MLAWLETLGVVVVALGAAGAGWKAGDPERRLWIVSSGLALPPLVGIALCRWFWRLEAWGPFAWLMDGRVEFVVAAAAVPLVLVPAARRLERRRTGALLGVLTGLTVLYLGILPFLVPTLLRGRHRALETRIDPDGVCLQTTPYTCGPAAAVTVLRHLGLPAEEGDLAATAGSSPIYGTPPDLLSGALERRYAAEGLRSEVRFFDDFGDLAAAAPCIVQVKLTPVLDHWVAVLEATDRTARVADPLLGRRTRTRAEFVDRWRALGIVVRVDGSRAHSRRNLWGRRSAMRTTRTSSAPSRMRTRVSGP